MDEWDLKPARNLELPPCEQYRSVSREGGLMESILRAVWWSSMRLSLTVFHRIEYHGREHLPEKPSFILAANHESHLDALVIGSALPLRMRDQLFPLAAGDLFFEVPGVAAFSALVLNALPVVAAKLRETRPGRSAKQAAGGEMCLRFVSRGHTYAFWPDGDVSCRRWHADGWHLRTGHPVLPERNLSCVSSQTHYPPLHKDLAVDR